MFSESFIENGWDSISYPSFVDELRALRMRSLKPPISTAMSKSSSRNPSSGGASSAPNQMTPTNSGISGKTPWTSPESGRAWSKPPRRVPSEKIMPSG